MSEAVKAANQLLQQPAAAILVPRDIKALSAAAAAELIVRRRRTRESKRYGGRFKPNVGPAPVSAAAVA
jgi:hypothetical protein